MIITLALINDLKYFHNTRDIANVEFYVKIKLDLRRAEQPESN